MCELTTFLVSEEGGSSACEDNMRNIFSGFIDTRLVDVTGSFVRGAPSAIFNTSNRVCFAVSKLLKIE